MSGFMSLNGTWGLTWAEGSGRMQPEQYTRPTLRGHRLLEAAVPAPVHRVLMDAGLLADINVGLNSLAARWVEEQFWVYRHAFEAPAEAARQSAWLVFDRLELDAIVWLNGQEIGRHANAHRPARFDVTGRLQAGRNLLVVQIATGMHASADKPAAEYQCHTIDFLVKRHWHRKAQYQCGWDWNPRLMNVGILGDVTLEWCAGPRLADATVFAVCADDLRSAVVHARCTTEHRGDEPTEATLRARVVDTDQTVTRTVSVEPGEHRHELTLTLEDPRLWWPVGHGEQALYTVELELAGGSERQQVTRRTGVRHVRIDQSPHPEQGRYFILRVNDRPIFCKGANWVPPDLLYSSVTAERTRELVDLALGANFNLLRIWGGGVLADRALCEACDEKGVLLWHDFLFACSKYPGDDPTFAAEVRREVTHQVRARAHHPSLVVWCGNNEIEWADWTWGWDRTGRTAPHYAIFHHDMPKIVRAEDPSTPYWPSSPFSPDQQDPNDPHAGDQHPWGVSILEPGPADFWRYRGCVDRFPNEGGVIGMSPPASVRQSLPGDQCRMLSPGWEHHDNPFACLPANNTGEIGRAYATVELWTGRDPLEMDWPAYAFVSALLQAEGLCEYIANYRRRMFSSASAIFWMYNDSWPATHSWTIVDYYRRRRLAYHPVRRAFAPVTVVVVEEEGEITVFGINDTPRPWSGRLHYGLFTLAGDRPTDERIAVELPANASTPLARFTRDAWEKLGLRRSGAFAVLDDGHQPIARHRLFLERFKDLAFVEPNVALELADGVLTCRCDVFAWGVCLDLDGEAPLADNCFDLLPGIPHHLPWDAKLGQPRVLHIGSRDAV